MSLFGPDSDNRFIASDDDGGPGTLSSLARDLEIDQYFVRVRHFSPSSTGSYGISVRASSS